MDTIWTREQIGASDADCIIFLCDATEGNYDPQRDSDSFLRQERLAIFRIFLYLPEAIHRTPTALTQIKLPKQRKFCLANLSSISTNNIDYKTVNNLIKTYKKSHRNLKDCKILAEAEVSGCSYLLTYDKKLKKHLRDKTIVNMISPYEFWNKNAPPKGCKPYLMPHWSNTKVNQDWYKW